MPKQATISEEQKDQVVDLYLAGKKWKDIAADVGIKPSNIGWILHERGVHRARHRKAMEEAAKDNRIAVLEDEVARLRQDNALLRRENTVAHRQLDMAMSILEARRN